MWAHSPADAGAGSQALMVASGTDYAAAGVGDMQQVGVGASVVSGLAVAAGERLLIALGGRIQEARCAAASVAVEGGLRDGKLGKSCLEYSQA
jgi:hypothetical protein